MARKKAGTPTKRRWLDHRALVLSEAVLAVGLLQELLENWILALPDVPPLLRVVAAIAVVVGTLGGMMLVLRDRMHEWIAGTHDALQARLSVPSVVLHALFLLTLFAGYCWLWDDQTGALGALWRFLALR